MAFTQVDLDALDKLWADARGARVMTFEGQSVTLGTMAEYLQLRSLMKREIDAARTHRLAVTQKGT